MADLVNLNLSVELRPWTRIACHILAWACALSCILSMRLADWLCGKGASLLARHGVRCVVEEAPVSPTLLLTYQPAP